MRSVLGVACVVLVACGGAGARDRQASPIVGGALDSADPEVVGFLSGGFPFCSGTLVSPIAVLTAGHCVWLLGDGGDYRVAFGADATHPDRKVRVVNQVVHPRYTAEGAPYDFAMLELDSPVTDVVPARVAVAPLEASDVGRPIRHVGYGAADEATGDGWGQKRQATYGITEVDPLIVWSGGLGAQTCNGDSGGPGFVTRDGGEELAAVVSDGPNCTDAGWDGRVDVVAEWISATALAWAPDAGPAPAAPTAQGGGCASADGAWGLALLAALAVSGRRGS